MVDEVVPGSPADKAGLKAGDVITEFNGNPVVSLPAFRLNVAASDIGKSYELTYYRDGKKRTTDDRPRRLREGGLRPRRSESASEDASRSPSPPRRRSTTSAWKSSR